MRVSGCKINLIPGALLLAFLLLALSGSAEASSRRSHRHRHVPLALRPLVAARTVVHAAVFGAPRVLSSSVRVAYQTGRPARERIFEGQPIAETEAYFTSQRRHPRLPRDDNSDWDDENNDTPRRAQASDHDDETTPIARGGRAVLHNGVAVPPANAPASVRNAIRAANTLRRKPYIWGGGHGSFNDRGYDCSGTVSFALHHAGVLATPLPSSELMRYGQGGRGRWITIYSRPGHTFAMIAGLRLDTTDFAIGGNVGPRWHADRRDTFGYVARHPVGL